MSKNTRFYVTSAVTILALTVGSVLAMAAAGTHRDVVATVLSMVVGFSSLIVSNARVATLAAAKADEVRDALMLAANDTVRKAETVKDALIASDAEHAGTLADIKTTTSATLGLVESEHAVALRALAVALRHVATITERKADVAAAEHAEQALPENGPQS